MIRKKDGVRLVESMRWGLLHFRTASMRVGMDRIWAGQRKQAGDYYWIEREADAASDCRRSLLSL